MLSSFLTQPDFKQLLFIETLVHRGKRAGGTKTIRTLKRYESTARYIEWPHSFRKKSS